jgi:hypothetical protein
MRSGPHLGSWPSRTRTHLFPHLPATNRCGRRSCAIGWFTPWCNYQSNNASLLKCVTSLAIRVRKFQRS